MENKKGKAVLKQFEHLKSIRQPLNRDYQDCYDYVNPTLGSGFEQCNDGISNAQTARGKQARLFDSTATDAVRLLSSSVLSSLTPPNTVWFDLGIDGVDEEDVDQLVKEWLRDCSERLHTMVHASNYDTESLDLMNHQMIAGMAGLYVELKKGKFHFECWPLHNLYCQETLNDGYIDTVYRQFEYTVKEAVLEFGLDKLPQRMQEAYANNEDDMKKHKFTVAIRPRIKNGKQADGRMGKNLPWESLWVADCGTVVREGGFNEMPVIVPRWMKIPDTDYARGPVFDALPDIKTLNKTKENMLLNMDMHITGMYKVKDDGVINFANIKFGSRRVIPVGDMDNIAPLHTGGDIRFGTEQIVSMQQSIRKILLADQLGPTEKAVMTATEVATRNNQVRQILGPIFARLQSEYLTHLIARCFGLAARAGLLPAAPPGTEGEVRVVYRSPLARSQKLQELEAVDDYVKRLVSTAGAIQDTSILDRFDFDRAAKKMGDLLGVDPELIRDDRAVMQIRQRRQQAMERQAAAAATAEAQATAAQAAGPEPTAASGIALV